MARLAQGDYQGTGLENYARFTLHEGKYAFLIDVDTGPGGDLVPPQSIAVLEVLS